MTNSAGSLIEKLRAAEWFPEGYDGDGVIYTDHVIRILRDREEEWRKFWEAEPSVEVKAMHAKVFGPDNRTPDRNSFFGDLKESMQELVEYAEATAKPNELLSLAALLSDERTVEALQLAAARYADTLPETSTGATLLRSHRIGFAREILEALKRLAGV